MTALWKWPSTTLRPPIIEPPWRTRCRVSGPALLVRTVPF